MVLPTNIDSTYADDGSDASVALHQQYHDTIHTAVNAAAGGTTGQVWQKTSSADYAASFVTPPWAGGDCFTTGKYTISAWSTGTYTTMPMTLNQVYSCPYLVPVRRAFDRIAARVSTASAAASGGVLRMGIYSDAGGKPGTLVVDAGTISSESTGDKEITISQTLDAGLYWLVVVAQVVTCTINRHPGTSRSPFTPQAGTLSNGDGSTSQPVRTAQSGALPSPFAHNATNDFMPYMGLRAA